MTLDEQMALAILRCGRSYGEALEFTSLTLEEVMALWRRYANGD